MQGCGTITNAFAESRPKKGFIRGVSGRANQLIPAFSPLAEGKKIGKKRKWK
jgi:hypothetical protein